MKRVPLYAALICLVVLFVSCKKEKSNTDNTDAYISFKIDGVQKNYKAKALAVQVAINNAYALGLTAFQNSTSLEYISLNIGQKTKPVTTGTYIDPGPDEDKLVVGAGYNPGTTDEAKMYAAGMQVDNKPRLHITITTLTAKNISGTFYGTFYNNGGDGPGTAAFTEGKFNLPLN